MIFEQSNSSHLKSWLVKSLEPICDAEPGALADYILALLQHNVAENEMRKELTSQLDEFLEKECTPFIDTLFTALRSKSYLPYLSSPPSPSGKSLDTGIPIPLDGLLEGSRKRSLEHDDSEGGPPAKGPRLGSDDHFSRYNNDTGHDPRYGMSRGGRLQGNGYRDSRSAYQPPDQRRVCRDYYNQGYCSRGALCKYSHGEDAIVPAQLYMNNPMMQAGLPFMPMLANGFSMMGGVGPVTAYDPHESKMDMRSNGNRQARPSVLPRMQSEDGGRVVHNSLASGELPVIQDLTPEVSYQDVTPNPHQHSSPQPIPLIQPSTETFRQPYPEQLPADVEMFTSEPHTPSRAPGTAFRGGSRGRGGGGPGSFRPERRKDKTLVLEKIPEDKLTLALVNDWFKRFGTVTNVAIDQANKKALISFSTHEEAFAAWKSEDAVFNNRFVKVFWHRPMEGHGQVGQRMLAASAPAIVNANRSKDDSETETKPPTNLSSTATPLAIKQQKLEQLITEQKTLMSSLDTASPEERKSIMARLRSLDEEMTATTSTTTSKGPPKEKEDKERERLDKELDFRGAVVGDGEDAKETTEELKAKLEKLKAEAASLGIPSETHHGGGSYRPYRGRARGFFRGGFRGGAPRASMKLDNRPRQLLVKDAGSDGLQAVRDWYETTGQMETVVVNDEGNIIVSFKSRQAAEQGLAKGTSIPMLGNVQVGWYSGPIPTPSKDSDPSPIDAKPEPERSVGSPTHTPRHEEEVIASGWGGDDDGMGMI